MKITDPRHIVATLRKKGPAYIADIALKYYTKQWMERLLMSIHKKEIRNAPQDTSMDELLSFISYTCNGTLKPLQIREEIVGLLQFLSKRKPKTIVEIGTANGGTLFLLTKIASPRATIVSIDMPGGMFGGGYGEHKTRVFEQFASKGQQMYFLRADSQDPTTREKLATLLSKQKIDVLFIDGDHRYEGVKRDYELYQPLVKKKGIIVFHDIVKHRKDLDCNVDQFWKEVRRGEKSKTFVADWDQGFAGIGVLEKS